MLSSIREFQHGSEFTKTKDKTKRGLNTIKRTLITQLLKYFIQS